MNRTSNGSSAPVPGRRRSPAVAAAALVAVALALALAPAALAAGAQAQAGGSSWRISQLPLPGNVTTKEGGIGAVSCRTSAQCVAVGDYQDSVTPSAGLIESWSGHSWSASQAPLPAGATANPRVILGAISCPARTTFCVAGGSVWTPGHAPQAPLLLTESGGTWTAAIAPVPGGDPATTDSWISGVSCVTATWCMADGYAASGRHFPGLLLHLSGTRWTASSAPVPAGGGTIPSLGGVSCTSLHFCVAAGNYQKSPGEIVPMALTWNGRRWSARRMPLPRTASPTTTAISAVACRSRKLCVAVGYSTSSAGPILGLIELWNGSKWTASAAPLPDRQRGLETELTGVACPSAKSCTAIGDYTNSTYVATGFLLTWSHRKWTATAANKYATVNEELAGISCPSATLCVAGVSIPAGPAILTGP
jgi:hypothetical protein